MNEATTCHPSGHLVLNHITTAELVTRVVTEKLLRVTWFPERRSSRNKTHVGDRLDRYWSLKRRVSISLTFSFRVSVKLYGKKAINAPVLSKSKQVSQGPSISLSSIAIYTLRIDLFILHFYARKTVSSDST